MAIATRIPWTKTGNVNTVVYDVDSTGVKIPVGDRAVIMTYLDASNSMATAPTDDSNPAARGSNTWSAQRTSAQVGPGRIIIVDATMAAAKAISGTDQITWGINNGGGSLFEVPDLVTPITLDVATTAGTTGTSTTPASPATGVIATANDVVFAVFCFTSDPGAISAVTAGWIQIGATQALVVTNAGAIVYQALFALQNPPTGSTVAAMGFTTANSTTWNARSIAYKGNAPAAAGGSQPRIVVSREAQSRASRW